MIVIEILLAVGLVALIAIGLYAGYKFGKK